MTAAEASGSVGAGEETPTTDGEEPNGTGLQGPLPDLVRARVVALAADSLGSMPADQLPPALKRVASFAQARRAKLAGTQIAGVLETDETFRERLALQVRAHVAELAEALEEGTTPAAADPVELAAVAYLLRPKGWKDVVERAAEVADAERHAAANREVTAHAERLRRQLDETLNELKETRERNRQQVSALKAENSELRHKLGDARTRLKGVEEAARAKEARADQVLEQAAAAAAGNEAELHPESVLRLMDCDDRLQPLDRGRMRVARGIPYRAQSFDRFAAVAPCRGAKRDPQIPNVPSGRSR